MNTPEAAELIRHVFMLAGRATPYPILDMAVAWTPTLADVDLGAAIAAVSESTWQHPPNATQIRGLVLKRAGIGVGDEEEVVAVIIDAVRKFGFPGAQEGRLDELDSVALAVIQAAGGWAKVCTSNDDFIAGGLARAYRSVVAGWSSSGSPQLTGPRSIGELLALSTTTSGRVVAARACARGEG